MHDLIYRKEEFDFKESFRYELSIQAGLDGFLFLVKDPDSGEIPLLFHSLFSLSNENLLVRKLREIYDLHEILRLPFRKTETFVSNPDFILIPKSLYSEKLAARILSDNQKPWDDRETIVMMPGNPDATLTFTAGKVLLEFLEENHPGCLIGHEMIRLLHNFGKGESPAVFIHLHNRWFYALAFSGGRLEFQNTFRFASGADFLYYVLALAGQLQLRNVPLYISGVSEIAEDPSVLIRKHLPHAELLCRLPGSEVPTGHTHLPFHLLPGLTVI
ncbi:MAG: DUF3822 family protein [Prolixibacteraceae bacterium]|jgi:hypothetical protein|nr:DUF3822 family protein [Bacteroidota bacterium]NLS99047.1 DUF3822 family protein [Bacteroidales bacterium]HNU76750.1 DUF3822 family protein [Prolixibacteraceae bacterium]HNZ68175.1 DUF3822 family protein [Prolixibacteraceae bacterium]HOC85576.1 DUF3822 family protein [Prolixibacteraceae bacterium]